MLNYRIWSLITDLKDLLFVLQVSGWTFDKKEKYLLIILMCAVITDLIQQLPTAVFR